MTSQMQGVSPSYDKPCEIVSLLDHSGSMESTRWPTINGYNLFLREQRGIPGVAYVSLAQFDDQYEWVYMGRPILQAPELTYETMVPRGSTALYDAIIRCGNEMLEKIVGDKHRAIFNILTDGGENASRNKDPRAVGQVIERLRARGWQVMFIGANQDAIMSAQQFGLPAGFAMSAMSNAAGTAAAYNAVSESAAAYRATGSVKKFTTAMRQAQVDAGLSANVAHLDIPEGEDVNLSSANGTTSVSPPA